MCAARANRFAPPAQDSSLASTYGYAYQFDATLFGHSIHLLLRETSDADTDAAGLRRVLTDSGLGPRDIRPIEPTLEDVFVMLTRKHANDRAAAGRA